MSKPAWLIGRALRLAGVPCAEEIAMMLQKRSADPAPTASMFLYGTPNESGNIGLRNGDSVTYYKGAVVQSIDSFYTDELKAQYPYLIMKYNGLGFILGEVMMYLTTKPMVYYPNGRYKLQADDKGAFDYIMYTGNPLMVDGTHGDDWLYWDKRTEETDLGDSACWSNYDILNEDGSLYMAKSDPITVSGIVGYNYNGMVLPPLPESALPYAVIVRKKYESSSVICYLALFDTIGRWNREQGRVVVPAGTTVAQYILRVASPNVWGLITWSTNGVTTTEIAMPPTWVDTFVYMWANIDLHDEDGQLAVNKAPDPIPVYE